MKNVTFLRALAALALGVLVSAARLHGQDAPLPTPLDFTFGMVGLAPGQNARLNVVNIGRAGSDQIPCALVLAFLDDTGRALKQAFVQVNRGKAAFLDLTANEATQNHELGSDSARIQIRGIGYNPLLIPVSLSCGLVPTLEVFNIDTGTTSVILTNWLRLTAMPAQ